jgi:hypothetical protein
MKCGDNEIAETDKKPQTVFKALGLAIVIGATWVGRLRR